MARSIQAFQPPAFEFDLFQLEEFRFAPYTEPHRHDYFEVVWFTSGAGGHSIDFQPYRANVNRLFLIAPGQVHHTPSKNVRATTTVFGTGFEDPATRHEADLFRRGSEPFIDVPAREVPRLRALVDQMNAEYARDAPHWGIVRCLLGAFLFEVRRIRGPFDRSHGSRAVDEIIAALLDLIEAKFFRERKSSFYSKETCRHRQKAQFDHTIDPLENGRPTGDRSRRTRGEALAQVQLAKRQRSCVRPRLRRSRLLLALLSSPRWPEPGRVSRNGVRSVLLAIVGRHAIELFERELRLVRSRWVSALQAVAQVGRSS